MTGVSGILLRLIFLFGKRYHPFKRDTGEVLGLIVDNDLVCNYAVHEIIHRPGQVLRSDAIHRRTHAEVGCEQMDLFVREALLKSIDKIQFSSDSPFRSARRILDGLDDETRRAVQITFLDYLAHAFGMYKDLNSGNFITNFIDMP